MYDYKNGQFNGVQEEVTMAKVLLLNGSPKADGCTATALNEMIAVFNEEGIDTEIGIEGDYEGIGHCALGYAAEPLKDAAPRKTNYVYCVE